MEATKYYVTVDNQTKAENLSLDYALLFVKAIFEEYYGEHDMVIAIAEMPRFAMAYEAGVKCSEEGRK